MLIHTSQVYGKLGISELRNGDVNCVYSANTGINALLSNASDARLKNGKTTRKSSGDSFLQFIIHIKRRNERA